MILCDDGSIEIHQSWLKTYLMCPERARRDAAEPVRVESDATAIGTAVHAGMELTIEYKRDEGVLIDMQDAIDASLRRWDELEPTIDLWFTSTPDEARNQVALCTAALYCDVLPQLRIDETSRCEHKFRVHLMDHPSWLDGPLDAPTPVYLAGAIDYIDARGIWDWKTAGSAYKGWEHQRWGIQETAYAYGAVQDGLLQWPVDFRFGVAIKNKTKFGAQTVHVRRFGPEVEWLKRVVKGALDTLDALGFDGEWPVIDSHSLCSQKWCPYWDRCKGKHLTEDAFLWKP